MYYDVDYVKNAKGTNYWRNRLVILLSVFQCWELQVKCFLFMAASHYPESVYCTSDYNSGSFLIVLILVQMDIKLDSKYIV